MTSSGSDDVLTVCLVILAEDIGAMRTLQHTTRTARILQSDVCCCAESNEQMLFHGSSLDVIEIIANEGFDMRLNVVGAVGRGTYFAERSSTSLSYSAKPSARSMSAMPHAPMNMAPPGWGAMPGFGGIPPGFGGGPAGFGGLPGLPAMPPAAFMNPALQQAWAAGSARNAKPSAKGKAKKQQQQLPMQQQQLLHQQQPSTLLPPMPPGGRYRMFLARVAVGKQCQARAGLLKPDAGYQSAVAPNMTAGDSFHVIFENDQVGPTL